MDETRSGGQVLGLPASQTRNDNSLAMHMTRSALPDPRELGLSICASMREGDAVEVRNMVRMVEGHWIVLTMNRDREGLSYLWRETIGAVVEAARQIQTWSDLRDRWSGLLDLTRNWLEMDRRGSGEEELAWIWSDSTKYGRQIFEVLCQEDCLESEKLRARIERPGQRVSPQNFLGHMNRLIARGYIRRVGRNLFALGAKGIAAKASFERICRRTEELLHVGRCMTVDDIAEFLGESHLFASLLVKEALRTKLLEDLGNGQYRFGDREYWLTWPRRSVSFETGQKHVGPDKALVRITNSALRVTEGRSFAGATSDFPFLQSLIFISQTE